MSNEKTQWRMDVETRLDQAKSPSQKLRFAMFELHHLLIKDGILPPHDNFDLYYAGWIEKNCVLMMDKAEEIMLKLEASAPKIDPLE